MLSGDISVRYHILQTISQEVRVRVQDVNDYTPIIRNLPLIATVRENQPPGTFIINITTDDEDMGFNAAVEIFIDDVSQTLVS